MEIYIGQEDSIGKKRRLNGYRFCCCKCGKPIIKRYNGCVFRDFEVDGYFIIEGGYIISKECICKKCAEKRKYIFIDEEHPIIRHKRLLEELKVVSERIYRKESKKIIKRIDDEMLDALNHETFEKIKNTTISETREKLKLIKEYACPETVLKFEEYIEERVQNIEEFADLKKKIILCEKELEQLLLSCKERIKCVRVVKDDCFDDDGEDVYEIIEYSKSKILQDIRDENKYKYKGPYWLYEELRIAMLRAKCWKWQEKENGN